MRGAGGSDGGLMPFFIGLIMMCGGFYMLLNSILCDHTSALVIAYIVWEASV